MILVKLMIDLEIHGTMVPQRDKMFLVVLQNETCRSWNNDGKPSCLLVAVESPKCACALGD